MSQAVDYQQTIAYLYNRLPMFTRIGALAYKKDIGNTLALLEAIDNPHKRFKSIHIAGTNGKGSCSHMLASVLDAAGYKTGLYTSPHLYDFRERIKVSGKDRLEMVSEDFVVSFTEKIKPIIESIEPSFFEVTVAMAFEWFALQQVDIAVIETGLGGRLDSTNVIEPELSIITNIGWDHMNLLGDSLSKIAYEKAGIIKPDTPVVIGEVLDETYSVFYEKAKEMNADILLAEKEWSIAETQSSTEGIQVQLFHSNSKQEVQLNTDLAGIYQQYNLRTIFTAIPVLKEKGFSIPDEALKKGLGQVQKKTGLGGRWQVIGKAPFVVLEVAHNEAGIIQMLHSVQDFKMHHQLAGIHIILGMAKDKETEKVLRILPPEASYYFTQAQLPRALPFEELTRNAGHFNLTGHGYPTPDEALSAAKKAASEQDLIIVCGSIFVVGEISLPAT